MLKRIIIIATGLLTGLSAHAKEPLDHDAFDSWEGVRVTSLSNNGQWAAYQVNPQEGDGRLYIRNTTTGKQYVINRGYSPRFTANSLWAVALIKPEYAATRQAKIDKKKGFDMPQDSLVVVNLKTGAITRTPHVIGYKTGSDGGEWIAYQSCDTTLIKPKALKDKEAGRPLVVRHLPSGTQKVVNWTKTYSMSRDGMKVAATLQPHKSDTVAVAGMGMIMLPDTSFVLIDRKKNFYGTPVFSYNSDKLAFTASNDSVKTGTKRVDLYYLNNINGSLSDPVQVYVPNVKNPEMRLMRPNPDDTVAMRAWAEAQKAASGDSLFINQYSVPVFSRNGNRLIVGVAPQIAPDDTTIVDFEQAALDIWRWDAPYTPPQEATMRDKMRKKTFPVVVDIQNGMHSLLLTADPLVTVTPSDHWNGRYALLQDPGEYQVMRQWDYTAPEHLSVIDLTTGAVTAVAQVPSEMSGLSPMGKYVMWFEDKQYHCYDISTGKTAVISADVEFPLWDEDQDIPMMRQPYGFAGWLANDEAVLVYDRYDIWSLDPKGERKPVCLTNGNGRQQNLRYRYIQTDKEKTYIGVNEEVLLSVFNYKDKRNGLAVMKTGKPATPTLKTLEGNSFTQIRRAKNAPVYAFQKANFSTSPNVFIARNNDFAKAQQVTATNPQMAEYNWGTAELVNWYAYNGDFTEGVLYKPEDFDPNKKYPMLVVFYERNSEELYRHYTMEPSWSWVNYPFYVSRGYIILVPDVKYAPSIPGESAYNYICSGVEELCKRYEWIDRDRIGIDGQSWGGYQTSYLVTRTNMFACAGSGAPVANMTSAFGGIRWGTGDSRQAQYEKGQSRIGRNLWEATELYIANSPLFYADRVNTPLLIMHNDADGAVPWYQGIEMFMALRRLEKPVWMLQYNGEAHNIRARKNRKDITKRLQQFFDHYLKGAPMPRWMKEGIPAVRKGQDLGF